MTDSAPSIITNDAPPTGWLDRLPTFSLRFIPIFRRNFMVWLRSFWERLLGNIADPLITLVAFGYGLGSLLPQIEGVSYLQFLASGSICMSVMHSAKFESLWGAFTRLQIQKTWDALLHAPMAIDDVLLAEALWAGAKAWFTGFAILLVIFMLGISTSPIALLCLPALFLIGVAFSAMALFATAFAKSYDFFTYYFTLFVTPMTFISGVFFPISALPQWLQAISQWTPLTAAIDLVRPLILGQWPQSPARDIAILLVTIVLFYSLAVIKMRQRMTR